MRRIEQTTVELSDTERAVIWNAMTIASAIVVAVGPTVGNETAMHAMRARDNLDFLLKRCPGQASGDESEPVPEE